MINVSNDAELRNEYGTVAKAVVMEAVSARSAANNLDLFGCAGVSAPGYEGGIR
jgi:hypothetical protein